MKAVISVIVCAVVMSVAYAGTPANGSAKKPQQVRSYSELLALLKKHKPASTPRVTVATRLVDNVVTLSGSFSTAVQAQTASVSSDSSSVSYSTTNVQVAGVDEGDIVKTDGRYIYQVNHRRIVVLRGWPAEAAAVESTITFSDTHFYPREIYIEGDRLIVVGNSWRLLGKQQWADLTSGTVKVMIYSVKNPAAPTEEREVEFDADFISSRRVANSLYLVGRKYPDYYGLVRGIASAGALVPQVRSGLAGRGRFTPLNVRNIFYFPDFLEPDYVVVAGLDLSNPTSALNVKAYLGAGDMVYASTENLYVAASRYSSLRPMLQVVGDSTTRVADVSSTGEKTAIYKFALSNSTTAFIARGEVPGSVLNQYSMDENNGCLRVATTLHGWWWNSSTDRNGLSVLDSNMQLVGSLSDIAPGERIYAARFMGDRCYLVTYKNTDPLFVIDLANPRQPAVLGQLEMPGFSNYLHPYDATHIIGIGRNTTNVTSGTWQVDLTQGIKIALYDVTDVAHPIEMFSTSIGDRGSSSDALNNPKAFLFDRDRNLLALPVSVATINPSSPYASSGWAWGDVTFQGAYVYDLTLDGGFVLKGGVTHIPEGQSIWSNWDLFVNRILYIKDDLYTLSDGKMKINSLKTLEEQKSIDLPPAPEEKFTQPIHIMPLIPVGGVVRILGD